jgi:hypothetical protein
MMTRPKNGAPPALTTCRCFRIDRLYLQKKRYCEDVICADLNGDGKIDIIGVGSGAKNVKVYWNEGKRR